MLAFFRVIGWSLIGFLIAGALAFGGFLVFNYDEILGPPDANEIQAWARFSAIMGSLFFAMVGFIVGAIYGIARARSSPFGP
jgi:hypothetical protein